MNPLADPAPPATESATAGQSPCSDAELNSLCERIFDWTGNEGFAQSSEWLIAIPLRIAVIVGVGLILRWLLHRGIRRLLNRPQVQPPQSEASTAAQLRRRQRAATLGSVLESMTTVVVAVFIILTSLAELTFNIGPLLAGAGVIGLAAGFGAQAIVKDFLSGMFMLLEDQYGVGDEVDMGVVDLDGTTGVVESVGLRITSIRDPDDVLWHVRNGEVLRVGNRSRRRGRGAPASGMTGE